MLRLYFHLFGFDLPGFDLFGFEPLGPDFSDPYQLWL